MQESELGLNSNYIHDTEKVNWLSCGGRCAFILYFKKISSKSLYTLLDTYDNMIFIDVILCSITVRTS